MVELRILAGLLGMRWMELIGSRTNVAVSLTVVFFFNDDALKHLQL